MVLSAVHTNNEKTSQALMYFVFVVLKSAKIFLKFVLFLRGDFGDFIFYKVCFCATAKSIQFSIKTLSTPAAKPLPSFCLFSEFLLQVLRLMVSLKKKKYSNNLGQVQTLSQKFFLN